MRNSHHTRAIPRGSHPAHTWYTVRLLLETVVVALVLAGFAAGVGTPPRVVQVLAIVVSGCWIHRTYVVGHEAVHRKLLPDHPWLNDLIGQLMLLSMLVPLPVYRKIHYFHHGHNRRDRHTSALDIFVVKPGSGWFVRARYHMLWFAAVFCGGFFIHSVVSIILFLCLPLGVARRISPAFRGWGGRERLYSWLALFTGLALHTGVIEFAGLDTWLLACGYPMVVFAWVYSLFVYIYHYRTRLGAPTQKNVRSLRRNPVIAYWLLNFHEHTAHHQNPNLPWYELPRAGEAHCGPRLSVFAAVMQQLRGPTIFETNSNDEVDTHE